MSERRPRPRPVRKAVLIVCEGAQTEPCYFERLKKALGLAATVDVVIDGNTGYTDPIGLVTAAQTLIQKRKRDARRSTTLTEFEEVWVVFDVEHASNGRGPQIAPAVVSALTQRSSPLFRGRASRSGICCTIARPHPACPVATMRGRI